MGIEHNCTYVLTFSITNAISNIKEAMHALNNFPKVYKITFVYNLMLPSK